MDILLMILAVFYLCGAIKIGKYLAILTLGYFVLRIYCFLTRCSAE